MLVQKHDRKKVHLIYQIHEFGRTISLKSLNVRCDLYQFDAEACTLSCFYLEFELEFEKHIEIKIAGLVLAC